MRRKETPRRTSPPFPTSHSLAALPPPPRLQDPWVVPSGGDWGLRPAGAVNFVGAQRCTLSGALFQRTDGNAIFLGGWNRNVSVLDSEFVWLGMNAVASLGLTQQDDATGGEQPYGTLLSGLVVRELAIYEKQSSAYFLGRTPLSRVENSLFYNGPVSEETERAQAGPPRMQPPPLLTTRTSHTHTPHTHATARHD